MIVDTEAAMSVGEPAVRAEQRGEAWSSRYAVAGVFALFLAVVIGLQLLSGVYSSEFSVYPDEPAHYVTSVMVRDYLLHFHFQSPMGFAEEYYRHYPKVAFGHWPPVFYVFQSLWMTLFSVSRVSVRLEIALTSALLALGVFQEGRRWFGMAAATLAGLLTVVLPLVQDYSDQEMSEALLTLLCFQSAIYFSRYLDSERLRDAVWFGVFFALAVLTKGSGWLLTLLPAFALVLTRRLQLLLRPSFWAPVALVAITCVPWQLMTMHMADRGWDGGSKPTVGYTMNALVQFLAVFPRILGPLLLAFLLLGLLVLVVRPLLQGRVSASAASQFSLILSVWIFHSLVPAGIEDRKLVIAVPAMVLFVFAGGRWLADQFPSHSPAFRWRYRIVATITAAIFLVTTFSIPKVERFGFAAAARFLTTRADLKNSTILVSSESGGEGLLISEMAMDQPHPDAVVVRATKALAEMAWDGKGYHSNFSNPEEIANYLRQSGVRLVVLDTYSPQVRFPHNAMLREAIARDPRFQLIAHFPSSGHGATGEVQIFRVLS